MAASVDFIYTLEEQEAYKGLKKSGLYKTSGKRMIIENVLLAVFAVFFAASHFMSEAEGYFNLVMAVICVVFIAVVTLVPTLHMKKQAKLNSDGKKIKMHLTPNKLTMGDGEKSWVINLDGSSKYKLIDDELILIITPNRQLVVLPIRAIPREITVKVQSMLFEGMSEAS